MLNWIKAFIGQRSCKVRYGNALSKSNLLQTGLPQGALTSCTLFNVFINDIAELVQTVTGIKCLLYADDLVLWYSASKENAKERTESALNCGLKLLANWCDNNGMVINTAKTAFQTYPTGQEAKPLLSLDYVPDTIAWQNTFTDWEFTLDPRALYVTYRGKRRRPTRFGVQP
ncbi:unnamed protein product [Rodentolepis nana]|uniref:Reverse transcriptase domain-containing protein n=1 Tax=Rodentolepis nana TaxID=102285 RepID=A0A0R3TZD5_RODNA|nr:unnamed protein product [Rodentolepis nana]